ncbi:MAG TPA: hypothetical protein VG206_11675 [Terriglobia bacterium]|nr:hypothetical protein [Terriglobia bacterium]
MSSTPVPSTVHDAKLDRYFKVFANGADGLDLYQSEYQLSADGNDIFRNTKKIEYVIGAGENGFGFIVRRGQYLFEAPLSYYVKRQRWELSPGFQLADFGFGRPILTECLACHSGRVRPISRRNGMYEDSPFEELAIGCENCHGPGQLHVDERRRGMPLSGDTDTPIVNPAKLPHWLADNICMVCHEGGDARIPQPGKAVTDFRPGTPLDRTLAVFSIPQSPRSPGKSPLLGHYSLMILSKCYLDSAGKLGCITCHDPHQRPAGVEAVDYYRQKCLGCHAEQSCAVSLAARMKRVPADDCAGCHMPKQELDAVPHSVLTNHRIVARSDEPLPEAAFHQTTPALPDLIHLSANGDERVTPVPPVVLLQAYAQLLPEHPEYQKSYDAVLGEFAKTGSSDPVVLSELARQDIRDNTPPSLKRATGYLWTAIRNGDTEASDYGMLSNLLAADGKQQEAVDLVKRGIELNPYSIRLYRTLVVRYVSLKDYDKALAAMKKELELFPQDSLVRSLFDKKGTSIPNAGP